MNSLSEPLYEHVQSQIQDLVARLRKEAAINQAIAEADPLRVDKILQKLPAFNEQHDIAGICQALEQAIAHMPDLTAWNFTQCSAAIRDLSMLGASLVRFGREPADCVSGFSEVLQTLAASVAASIPRDSFIDYTSRNAVDERERTFTSLLQERIFIDSLRRGMSALDACLIHLLHACTFPFSHQECATSFHAAMSSFQTMIDAIVQVKRGITPEVFTHSIRPFFEPFRVAKRAFSAPSGAEMPILNIDQVIWGADCTDELYTTYFQANIIRLPAVYQEISQTVAGQKSLMTIITDRLASALPLSHEERRSLQELHHLLTKMYTFRMPHYKVAEENVILRQQERGEGQEVKGSSGFGLLETMYVLDQTIKCRQITSQALSLG
jgi:hypothetical protein